MPVTVQIRRVYDPPSPRDGARILVDRIWPRGLTKRKAHIDLWLKDIAPTTTLRQWFGHDATRWHEFRRRYRAELMRNPALLDSLRELARRRRVTLVFGARNERYNQAVVLKEILVRRASRARRAAPVR